MSSQLTLGPFPVLGVCVCVVSELMGQQGPWSWHLKSKADGGHGVEHSHPGRWSVGKHSVNP